MVFLKELFEEHGAVIKGLWPTEGYDFSDSRAVEDGMFYGLALDFDQQPHLTDKRIDQWVAQVRKEFGI
jgi:flavodoxin I